MIYFIQAGGAGGSIKIGTSRNPKSRMTKMQADNHAPLCLLGTMEGGKAEEAALHRTFAASLVQGEWFAATDELLAMVATLAVQPQEKKRRASLKRASFVKLAEHIERTGETLAEFGQAIGCTGASVSRILNGRQSPSAKVIRSIVKRSGGAITPNDFFDSPDPRPTSKMIGAQQ